MTGNRYVMRNLRTVALSCRRVVVFCGGDGPVQVRTTEQPAAWSALLQKLSTPCQYREIIDDKTLPQDVDSKVLDELIASGHLLAAEDPAVLIDNRNTALSSAPAFHLRPDAPQCSHLVIGCTGSVVAGLMAQTILSLRFTGFQEQLDVILTDAATRFVTRDLLEAYGIRCWRHGFEQQDNVRVPHVALAAAADIICVIPATADSLDRIARSACSDLLSLTITASEAPVVLAPVMNGTMWKNAGVQRNLDRLRTDGRFILEPTIIFAAAHFGPDAPPMYGGHGCLWSGPHGLMDALSAVLTLKASRKSS